MARIFITGSSDGIGLVAAQTLIKKGHTVTLHARNAQRAQDAERACPGSAGVLIADLSSIAQTKSLAAEANKIGKFDTVIHNAGIGFSQGYKKTEDGLSDVFAVNALAPYILTCLMEKPGNLVYVSSQLHSGGDAQLRDVEWKTKRWSGMQAYSDSKLMNVLLAFAVARHWPDVASNALSPGWVKTKMGGSGAPGSLSKGAELPVRLAESDSKKIGSGGYYSGSGRTEPNSAVKNEETQEEFLRVCERISGVKFPK
ncbi:putative daunorubicin C-13 ketoreductase [Mollisia scopiformis]|uniref:Putative daunorubicin C-13 ketoreductase n=1 Tax=Mollisia scopiformis TaxID=149040 RepID=A0A132BDH3_MOLSC|nr:putative daunorubicin C-13 ketoreductase [Mollisia scopiformis]KUJ10421.1 putative daunorubicin C-13 ketoreductase [Mollisia scopiformis]